MRNPASLRGIGGFLLTLSVLVSSGVPVVLADSDGYATRGPPPPGFPATERALGTRGDGDETGFEVGGYELAIGIDPQDHGLNGTVVIDFTPTTSLNTVPLYLFPELSVRRVRDSAGTSLGWEPGGFGMVLVSLDSQLCAGCPGTLQVDFSGVIGEDNVQLYNYIGPEGVFLMDYVVQDQPYNGSWFPWNGVAPVRMDVSVPRDFVVLAPGTLRAVIQTATEATYSWDIDRPWLAPHNLLVANRFQTFPVDFPGSNASLYLLPKDAGRAEELTSLIRRSLSYLSENFGDIPCRDLSIAETTMFSSSAQGSFCLITLHETVLGGDPLPVEIVLPHELAHQWWGSGIQFEGPGSGFLSEGSAQYSTYLYDRSANGTDNLIRIANGDAVGLARGEFGTEVPIANTTVDGTLRSEVTQYDKGSMVLHMLRYLVGGDAFFSILRTFAATYALSNATLDDFEATAIQVSGTDLTEFFRQWVYSVDTLDVRIGAVSSENGANGYVTRIPLTRVGHAKMPVDIRLRYSDGSSEVRAKVWGGTSDSTVVAVSSALQVVGAELDPDYWLLDLDRQNNVWPTGGGLVQLAIVVVPVVVAVSVAALLLIRRRRRRGSESRIVDKR